VGNTTLFLFNELFYNASVRMRHRIPLPFATTTNLPTMPTTFRSFSALMLNSSMIRLAKITSLGFSRLEGTFKAFSPLELQQADARVANTVFEKGLLAAKKRKFKQMIQRIRQGEIHSHSTVPFAYHSFLS
jgi:hypothetical protein